MCKHSQLSFSPCSQWSVCPAACTATATAAAAAAAAAGAASAWAAAAATSGGLSNSQISSWQDPHKVPLNSNDPAKLKTNLVLIWCHEVIVNLPYTFLPPVT